jgi:hypothetical protein
VVPEVVVIIEENIRKKIRKTRRVRKKKKKRNQKRKRSPKKIRKARKRRNQSQIKGTGPKRAEVRAATKKEEIDLLTTRDEGAGHHQPVRPARTRID